MKTENSNLGDLGVLAVEKPRKVMVSLAEGMAWRGGGKFLFLQKYDGCWTKGGLRLVRGRKTEIGGRSRWEIAKADEPAGLVLLTETMRGTTTAGCPARYYVAHSLAVLDGQSVLGESTRTRWRELCALAVDFPPWIRLAAAGNGGEFLEAVLAAGGEGVCAFDLDAPWGEMWACKRLATFYCVVTGFNGGTQSVKIGILHDYAKRGKMNHGLRGQGPEIYVSDCGSVKIAEVRGQMTEDGEQTSDFRLPTSDFGSVPLLGGKCDRVRVGSIIKVEGFGLTAGGKIREPRVCRDTATSWLVKY